MSDTVERVVNVIATLITVGGFVVLAIFLIVFADAIKSSFQYIGSLYMSLSEAWQIAIFTVVAPILLTFIATRYYYRKK